jgi:hypothetical protein
MVLRDWKSGSFGRQALVFGARLWITATPPHQCRGNRSSASPLR